MLISTSTRADDTFQARLKQSFMDGSVRSFVKRGVPAEQARWSANCMYGVLAAHLTSADWIELAMRVELDPSTRPPKALMALMPQLLPCLPAALFPPPSASPAAPVPALDQTDSARLVGQVRRLRLQQEAALRQTQGQLQKLPTGSCIADVRVGERGQPAGPIHVDCSDARLQDVVHQALSAIAPLQAASGSTVRLSVIANDPEPVAAATVGAPDARVDLADSVAVTRQVLNLRMQQMRQRVRSGSPPGPPLLGRCSAHVLITGSGLAAAGFPVDCTDPRLQNPMRQAIAAAGVLQAPPGSTVLLQVRAPFPAP